MYPRGSPLYTRISTQFLPHTRLLFCEMHFIPGTFEYLLFTSTFVVTLSTSALHIQRSSRTAFGVEV